MSATLESVKSPSRNVLHLIEGYAATGENYVFEQVNSQGPFVGHILAEWKLTFPFDPIEDARKSYFRRVARNELIERVVRFLARRVIESPYLWCLNRYFDAEARARKACLVHAHFGMMGYKCLTLVRHARLPMVVTFYGVDGSQALRDPYWRPRIQSMLAMASRVVVLCDEVKDRLVQLGGDPRRIEVWDIGIPVNDYPHRFPRAVGEAGVVKFLIVARFVEKKGYPLLLEAFARLVKAGLPVRLTIAGNGPLKGQIEQGIELHGIADQVELIDTAGRKGFFDLFKQLLQEHDIFVLPSIIASNGDDEGGPPVVIANAQAVGLPVISTPVGGITRAISDGETGFLVEPGSVDALAQCMRRLVEQPDLLARVSLNARRHVESNFDVAKQLQRVQQIYAEVLKEGGDSCR